jgi:cob(I)alamin adenosyltransferase
MKAQLKRQLKEDPALLREEIAVVTRDLRHYQSRLRSLNQSALRAGESEEARINRARALQAQCLQLMRVRRRLRSLL